MTSVITNIAQSTAKGIKGDKEWRRESRVAREMFWQKPSIPRLTPPQTSCLPAELSSFYLQLLFLKEMATDPFQRFTNIKGKTCETVSPYFMVRKQLLLVRGKLLTSKAGELHLN